MRSVTTLPCGLDAAQTQTFARMPVNATAANHDDHKKHHSLLLRQSGRRELFPAYDIIWAQNAQTGGYENT